MHRYLLYARKSQEDEGRQQQSIGDQIHIMTEIAAKHELNVIDTLTEEKSAKEPYQRPVFDAMMAAIQEDKADAVLCYHVNRLARNMVEGGLLQHLLTKGILKEIRTYNEVFKSGDNILPFILQTAMSTQYSLDLVQHVRRGIRSKIEKGGFPHRAPEGYRNAIETRSVETDTVRFPLIRKAWDLMLTGTYSVEQLAQVMNQEWGYRTRPSRKLGGGPITKSALHRLFHNVFYTGHFLHNGQLYKGDYPAMISFSEFEAVQRILERQGPRPRSREFAYTGLILCARCGHQITAEHKRGRHKRGDYIYYHCTNYRYCRAKPVRQEIIQTQIEAYLQSVAIAPDFREAAIQVIERLYAEESQREEAAYQQTNRALEEGQRRLSKLIQMSLNELISDEQFVSERRKIEETLNSLKVAAAKTERRLEEAREGALEVAHFVTGAPFAFLHGSLQQKREIARKLGITYRLRDGVLEAELHPLLVPLIGVKNSATEPLKIGFENTKNSPFEPSVAFGRTEGKVVESLISIWNLLLEGAPRLFWQE